MLPCGQITGKQLVSQLHWPAKNVLLQLEIRISSNSKKKKVSFEQIDFIPRGGGSILLQCPILGLGRKVAAQILSQFVRFSTTNIFTLIVCQILLQKYINSKQLVRFSPTNTFLSQFVRFSTTNIFFLIVCQILHRKYIYSHSLSYSQPQIDLLHIVSQILPHKYIFSHSLSDPPPQIYLLSQFVSFSTKNKFPRMSEIALAQCQLDHTLL